MTLRAAWLGSWRPPWPMTRGRRWGDRAWALATLSQAWMLGGREGRWPVASWRGQRPHPPILDDPPTSFLSRPPESWVALLRHGTPNLEAFRRGPKEDELTGACWTAVLEGDGDPWMALGTVILDLPTRLRWIPLLGAVDAEGRIMLPPFLEDLVPDCLRVLPPGWWESLLASMDSEGRLLPAGDLPLELPWADLKPHTDPLILDALPDPLLPHRDLPWLHALGDGKWMIDPALRAWGRGWGAAPAAFSPGDGLALGAAPTGAWADLLSGRLPGNGLPDGWQEAVAADLEERISRPECPPPSGHPTWDRFRSRWVDALPPRTAGYPEWGQRAHPCADPFHWMAEGRRAYGIPDAEGALWAFRYAHAHFRRLGATVWMQRAASNAATAALQWADLGAFRFYRAEAGPLPSRFKELEQIILLTVSGDWNQAMALCRDLGARHPGLHQPWTILGGRALFEDNVDWIREAHDHLEDMPFKKILAAALHGHLEEPEDLDPEVQIHWRGRLARRPGGGMDAFWQAWEGCASELLKLETGLALLEARPEARLSERLLALQSIAQRAESTHHLDRLDALWPEPLETVEPGPREMIDRWLQSRSGPAWLVHGGTQFPLQIGHGPAPPLGLLSRLRAEGSLPALAAEGFIWRGTLLRWEGAAVGACLLGEIPDAAPDPNANPELLAPWLARLNPSIAAVLSDSGSGLLSDRSEPMATLLRDLARVAPSPLPILVLGATGSGKELAAREIHRLSGRPGELVAVNCSAFAEGLLESELFGHVKGAFTGADRERRGAIEMAQHGTLFLDEIADVSARVQSMLLRVLQEREVRRVGGEGATAVDVRFVAATHKPLEQLIAKGAFRQDLLFRLQGTVLRMPSLSERRHEFPFLIPRLVALAAKALDRTAPDLAAGLPESLARLDWPGNVRELRHALDRALLRCNEGPLKPSHFPELDAPVTESRRWSEATHAFQRELLMDSLRRHRFQVADAADALGLARPALYLTAKRLGIDLNAERVRWLTDH